MVHAVDSYSGNMSRCTVHKTLNLQTVLLTFSPWYVLRLILDVSERNRDLDLEKTNIN